MHKNIFMMYANDIIYQYISRVKSIKYLEYFILPSKLKTSICCLLNYDHNILKFLITAALKILQ